MLHVTARPELNDAWFPVRKHRPPYSSQRDNAYSYTRFQREVTSLAQRKNQFAQHLDPET